VIPSAHLRFIRSAAHSREAGPARSYGVQALESVEGPARLRSTLYRKRRILSKSSAIREMRGLRGDLILNGFDKPCCSFCKSASFPILERCSLGEEPLLPGGDATSDNRSGQISC
jgi:hypothetical protein